MNKDRALPAEAGPGCSAEPEPISVVSADTASIPSADELPFVTHEGTIKLGDLEITVMRLSNGESVIEAESFQRLMAVMFDQEADFPDDAP